MDGCHLQALPESPCCLLYHRGTDPHRLHARLPGQLESPCRRPRGGREGGHGFYPHMLHLGALLRSQLYLFSWQPWLQTLIQETRLWEHHLLPSSLRLEMTGHPLQGISAPLPFPCQLSASPHVLY